LTSLNPVNGLYTSFFTGLTYILFCTSKHLSVGTFAVTSLMVFSSITRIEQKYADTLLSSKSDHVNDTVFDAVVNASNTTSNSFVEPDNYEFKVRIATSLAFWCGVCQVVMSFLKFGSISKYFSQALLRGFTTACAFQVFTTQVRHILGIYSPTKNKQKIFKAIIVGFFFLICLQLVFFICFGLRLI